MYQIHFCHWQPKEAIMNITKKISVLALSVYCSVFFAADSQSKVCFLGDDNCVNDVNFGNLEKDDSDNLCIKSGYILKEECQTNGNEYIVSYCPYNSSYVACCNKVYAYDSCPPLKYVGKCWNKYKCECDGIYKYTQEQCEQNNAYPAGSSCSHIAKNSEQTSIETVIKYSSCRCDRAIYKEDIKNCEDYDSNKVCTDSDGNQYTSSCVCNRDKYPKIAWDCDYGGEGEECVEDGITYVEDCCSCSGFPLKQLESGYQNCSGGCDKITKVEPCSCDHGKDMVKVVQCAAGWQPTSDRDGCERISCEAAVKLYMSKYPNDGYGLLEVIDGVTSIGYYEPLTDDERNALTGDDLATATYAVSDRWKETNFSTGVMYKSVRASEKGVKSYIGGSSAKTIMSAYAFANSLTGDTEEVNMIKGSCADTSNLRYEYDTTVIANDKTTYILKNVDLYILQYSPIIGDWQLTDSSFYSSVDVTFSGKVTLTADEDTPTFGSSGKSYTFSSSLTSSGYKLIGILTLKGNENTITLPSDGNSSVMSGKLYVNKLNIKGPSSGTAYITSSGYVGYDGARITKNATVTLDGNVTWRITGSNELALGTGGSVIANNPAAITTNDSTYHKCEMLGYQPLPYNDYDKGGTNNPSCDPRMACDNSGYPNGFPNANGDTYENCSGYFYFTGSVSQTGWKQCSKENGGCCTSLNNYGGDKNYNAQIVCSINAQNSYKRLTAQNLRNVGSVISHGNCLRDGAYNLPTVGILDNCTLTGYVKAGRKEGSCTGDQSLMTCSN